METGNRVQLEAAILDNFLLLAKRVIEDEARTSHLRRLAEAAMRAYAAAPAQNVLSDEAKSATETECPGTRIS